MSEERDGKGRVKLNFKLSQQEHARTKAAMADAGFENMSEYVRVALKKQVDLDIRGEK